MSSPISPEERFSKALHATARLWRGALDKRLRDLGVSESGWMTIALIAKSETPPSQSDLAQALSVEGASMVSMIDRLVKLGLVERVGSEADRRVKHIVLTDDGHKVFARVKQEADAFRAETVSRLDPEKLAVAADIMEQLQNFINES
ncbi:MarR family winged helix-turn-helix transcriptional regulator [Asticcacaulis sp. YBE204]|uniref:MarR family winged helix-turn-helix transcriptional regulator n=1 Tax=Asticcacaulis sp. YBE204 TaxID=1282363 RepID=UPI0003C3C3EF|nr:MarR family transcriptional regulator [Asticcacaulis sp. YBE204]ESQ77079.1 hypothetical protein AEYBE204_18540 [Asticcacaulis sp. YBE204]